MQRLIYFVLVVFSMPWVVSCAKPQPHEVTQTPVQSQAGNTNPVSSTNQASHPVSQPAPQPKVELASVPSQTKPLTAHEILNARCYSCHGAEQQKGGLRLDVAPTNVSGKQPIVVPGKPEPSELYRRVINNNDDEKMPPKGDPLMASEIETLKLWIASGAKWPAATPGTTPATSVSAKIPLRENERLPWSFAPITRPTVPIVGRHLCRNAVDNFILVKLEEKKIEPSPEADRVMLIRRLSLDLLGLLPTPSEVDAFVADQRKDAYEQLVDRLLASPHFGEKWAKPWLDLARYADSDGYEHDEPRPDAFHYRDWVIRAFNSDMPFDQFTIEQLAGDLLDLPSEDQLLATGFHRQTMKHNTSEMIAEEFKIKAIKDRVNTTGTAWMGLTIGCAECHAHKFDPIGHADYYRLYAFFHDAVEKDQAGSKSQRIMTFENSPTSTFVQKRGNPMMPGEQVEPGVPKALPALEAEGDHATRLDLAKWLMAPANPLTARVEVNRIWKQLFGVGLVATMDDFGNRGQLPSHPELLDWLATMWRDQKMSRKWLIRLIVTSATYRQSSRIRTELNTIDPANHLFARQNRFRLDAENIYDVSLQVAGNLKLDRVGGPSFQPPMPLGLDKNVIKNNRLLETSKPEDRNRRGLYLQIQRTYPHPFLTAFDAPDGSLSCAARDRSQTPAQALLLMNDPIYQECISSFAKRIEKQGKLKEEKLDFGFRLCFGRSPTTEESTILLELLKQQEKSVAKTPWQGVCSVLMNMEAFTTRE